MRCIGFLSTTQHLSILGSRSKSAASIDKKTRPISETSLDTTIELSDPDPFLNFDHAEITWSQPFSPSPSHLMPPRPESLQPTPSRSSNNDTPPIPVPKSFIIAFLALWPHVARSEAEAVWEWRLCTAVPHERTTIQLWGRKISHWWFDVLLVS